MSEHIYKTPRELPESAQKSLFELLYVLADTKHILGLRYGEWLGAPVLEASIAAISMAQDELGHARLFYSLIDDFTNAGLFKKHPEEPKEYRSLELLDHAFSDWPDFIVANTLYDSAMSTFFEAMRESSYEPMKQRMAKILDEEKFHFQHGKGWITRLASSSPKAKVELEKKIRAILPALMSWFGKPGSAPEQALAQPGIIEADSDGLRDRFLNTVAPVLQSANLELPITTDVITGQWILSTPLDWKGWDESARRFSKKGLDAQTWSQIESMIGHEYPVE
ncbi:phenylacetate-CoA oxygenase subunit PaaI [Candidatus Acetothermia bacterium]|nr:phenylacetate-CoA oxygenase subunit PaaI [Candidatus Acetothermia bacterium]